MYDTSQNDFAQWHQLTVIRASTRLAMRLIC